MNIFEIVFQGYKARSRDCVGEAVPGEGDVGVGQKFCDCDRRPAVSFTPVATFLNHIFDDFHRESFCSSSGTCFISLKGSDAMKYDFRAVTRDLWFINYESLTSHM